jgi:hypothetical protein
MLTPPEMIMKARRSTRVQVALVVEPADVAERGPALRVARLRRALRVVVVLELRAVGEVHQAGLAAGSSARFVADVQHALRGAAHRARVLQPLLRRDAAEAVVLGARVVLVDDRSPPVEHALLDLHRAGGGGMHRHLHRRQVVPQANVVGQLEQAHEHRRHPLAVRDAVALDAAAANVRRRSCSITNTAAAELDDRHAMAQRRGVVQRRRRQVAASAP